MTAGFPQHSTAQTVTCLKHHSFCTHIVNRPWFGKTL
ncbi:hypothetical protein E2C01_053861 [Portunus trituberculatus]|uniref:Uncharacterized protein n=1 Tax=Portunus trituberculatus TaxID=210409 RepID=A0A5B7GQG0_PORTR|nr:hypothetical protein [Portunus trituberculatus]